jgi:hypothetical protein
MPRHSSSRGKNLKTYFVLVALSCIPLLRLLVLDLYQRCGARLNELVRKPTIQN